MTAAALSRAPVVEMITKRISLGPPACEPAFSTISGMAGPGGRPKLPNPSFGNPAIRRFNLTRGFASQSRDWFAVSRSRLSNLLAISFRNWDAKISVASPRAAAWLR